jgi:thiamine biosynthesis lipoprotein
MLSSAAFKAMGVSNTVAVGDQAALEPALEIVRRQITAIDAACSRFRPDSELSAVNRSAGHGRIAISQLLCEALDAAMGAAQMTAGLVDPTVGKNVEDTGYTSTFRSVPLDGPPIEVCVRQVRGWHAVELDLARRTVGIPEGVGLDLGASGKAWAADRCARAVSEELGISVLVECGGDIATSGRAEWPVRVALDENSDDWQDVLLRDGGLATSGTSARKWRRGGVEIHDIIDPRTGAPAQTHWAMVTVAAASCLEANAAATAALILGTQAIAWLDSCRLPARLMALDGGVETTGGWAA